MKNLKKVLSLALAFAMVLGLCIGASAAQDVTTLKDWSEVENKSAATLLGAFNIMQGDDEGNFRPNDNVTRTEAAKMISVALWGGNDDVALYNAGNIGGYTDVVAGSWYMGYVNYMTVQSIVTGKGEGVFDPNGTVTGYELLKMCLVSLGYSPETEGMTGAGWDVRTMALATKPGFQNLTANTSVTNWNAPLSRTNAAQIIANMIYRETVYYSLQSGVGGNVTSRVQGNGTTFAQAVLGMAPRTGKIVANEYGTTDSTKTIDKEAKNYNGENTIVEIDATLKADGQTSNNDGFTAAIEMVSTAEDVGASITAFVVNGKTIVSATIVNPAEVTPKFGADGSIDNLDKDINGTTKTLKVSINGVTESKTESDLKNTDGQTNKIYSVVNKVMYVNNDAEVKFLDNDNDGYIDAVKAYKYIVREVKADNAKTKDAGDSYTFSKAGAEAADLKVVKTTCDFEAKKGDYVAVAAMPDGNVFSASAKSNHGYVLSTVEGKVTGTDGANSETIYIDGVKYANDDTTIVTTNEGVFHLYANGAVAKYVGPQAAADTYALIYDVGYEGVTGTAVGAGSSYTAQVAAVLPDGTDKTFTVKKFVTGTTPADPTPTTFASTFGGFYTDSTDLSKGKALNVISLMKYSLNSDGTINLYVDSTISSTMATSEKVTKGVAATSTGKLVNADTITFVQTKAQTATASDKWAVYKGMTTPTYTTKAATGLAQMTKTFSNGDTYAYIALKEAEFYFDGAKTSSLFLTLTDPGTRLVDNETVNQVKAYDFNTGKVMTLNYDEAETGITKDTFYSTLTDSVLSGVGIANANDTTKVVTGYVTNFGDGVIRVATYVDDDAQDAEEGALKEGTSAIIVLDSKVKYHLIDGDDSKEITAEDMADVVPQANHTKDKFEVIVLKDATNGNATTVIILKSAMTTIKNGVDA